METFFIILAYILIALLAISHSSFVSEAEEKLEKLKKAINGNSRAGNEHIRAFKELADFLGYCIHEEREVKFDLDSILGNKEPEWNSPKLVVHKKEPAPKVKKLKVKSRK